MFLGTHRKIVLIGCEDHLNPFRSEISVPSLNIQDLGPIISETQRVPIENRLTGERLKEKKLEVPFTTDEVKHGQRKLSGVVDSD